MSVEIKRVKCAMADLKKFCHFAKDYDQITVTEWSNGEGFYVDLADHCLSMTYGQLEAIQFLVKSIDLQEAP